jgi:hypothetical protein
MTLQFWLGFLAYLVPLFPLAYAWHLKTFKPAYDRLEMFREDVILPMGLASMVLQGLFFSWVFPKLFSGPSWVMNGLSFALVFGVVGWSFMVLPVAAKYRMASVRQFMLLETAFVALQFVVTGLLIAFVYRP